MSLRPVCERSVQLPYALAAVFEVNSLDRAKVDDMLPATAQPRLPNDLSWDRGARRSTQRAGTPGPADWERSGLNASVVRFIGIREQLAR